MSDEHWACRITWLLVRSPSSCRQDCGWLREAQLGHALASSGGFQATNHAFAATTANTWRANASPVGCQQKVSTAREAAVVRFWAKGPYLRW